MINLGKKRKNVYDVIQRNPMAANDDAVLLERYWIEVDGWDESKSLYWNLSRCTRPETITRRRRELHNLGLIKYTKKADKQREEAFGNEREQSAQQYAAVSWLKDSEECAA
jgi:hypothetical protein